MTRTTTSAVGSSSLVLGFSSVSLAVRPHCLVVSRLVAGVARPDFQSSLGSSSAARLKERNPLYRKFAIDPNKPLSDQGPFNVVLHKECRILQLIEF